MIWCQLLKVLIKTKFRIMARVATTVLKGSSSKSSIEMTVCSLLSPALLITSFSWDEARCV